MSGCYYRKNKGPFRNGLTFADRYDRVLNAVQTKIQKGDLLEQERSLAMRMGAQMSPHETELAALVRSAQIMPQGMQTRDVGAGDVIGVPILQTLSVAYSNGDFIGSELMPIAGVPQISGKYPVFPKRDKLQMVSGKGRGARGNGNEIVLNESEDSYETKPHAHTGKAATDAIIAGQIAQGRVPMDRLGRMISMVGYHHQLEHEVEVAGVVTDATNYGTDNKLTLSSGAKWDETGANIAKNIQDAKLAVWNGEGQTDQVFWCSAPIWNVISRNTSLLSLMSSTDAGFVTEAQFAQWFGFDGVLVSNFRVDTANIGQAIDTEYLWGNFAGIARVGRMQQMTAALGYTLRWQFGGLPAGAMASSTPDGMVTRLWFDIREGVFGSYFYKVGDYYAPKVVAADAAYLFSSVLNNFPTI